jgi:hypothetical protein
LLESVANVPTSIAFLHGGPDEPADEALPTVTIQPAWAVHVRKPERARAKTEDVAADEVIELGGGPVDAVDVGRPYATVLVDGKRGGSPVDLAVSGEYDLRGRVVSAACLQERELGATVQLEIVLRVLHAVDVAHLSGEIEDHLAVAHEGVQAGPVAQVDHVDPGPLLEAGHVVPVAAATRNQRIDDRDVGAEGDELVGEIAPDESEAAGDEHPPAPVLRSMVAAQHEISSSDA